jgi:hypothetical protein
VSSKIVSDGIYNFEVNSNTIVADEIRANGVTLNSGAQLSSIDLGSSTVAASYEVGDGSDLTLMVAVA